MKLAKEQISWGYWEDSLNKKNVYLNEDELEVFMLESKQIQYLKDLQNDSYHGIQIEADFSEDLQSLDLKVDQMNVIVSCDTYSGTGIEIPEEIDFMGLT